MVAWQIERGAGECLSFEELKRIVFVLSAFSWSLSHPSSCMLVNQGPSQQSSKEEYKPLK